jgi:ABC-type branched-subunit amino acid transport system ATPase component
VVDIAEATGLSEYTNRPGGLLAHGLKQGLELAAVVSNRPQVILLDEPTAGLTTNEREVIGAILTRLVREQHTTVILIEHDLDFVLRLADRIAVLAGGSMVECAPAAEIANSSVVRDVYVGTVGATAA